MKISDMTTKWFNRFKGLVLWTLLLLAVCEISNMALMHFLYGCDIVEFAFMGSKYFPTRDTWAPSWSNVTNCSFPVGADLQTDIFSNVLAWSVVLILAARKFLKWLFSPIEEDLHENDKHL